MKRAICLSGGGAKGAYQIGVLKGLKKLNIKYDIVTGTSVGALNGILYVQNDLRKGIKLWKKMNFEIIFDKKNIEDFNNLEVTSDIIKMYSANFFKNNGMNIDNLEKHAKKILNYKKFAKSNIDFSISTYNLTKNKAMKISKKDLTKDNILDYVLASSSCYPAIKKRKINNDYYIDGGIFDNLPINSAIDLGANEIIAVDLKAPGIKEHIKNKNINIIYITPKNDIGMFLNFNNQNSKRAIKIGYYDTLKKFNKLDGDYYTFKKNNLIKNEKRYVNDLTNNLNKILNGNNEIKSNITLKRMIKIGKNNLIINEIVEHLGKMLEIDDCKCYKINKFNKLVIKKVNDINVNIDFNHKFNYLNMFNKKKLIKEIYLMIINRKKYQNELNNLALTMPKEFLSALYIYTIEKRKI